VEAALFETPPAVHHGEADEGEPDQGANHETRPQMAEAPRPEARGASGLRHYWLSWRLLVADGASLAGSFGSGGRRFVGAMQRPAVARCTALPW
jgi:hypothetical protein